jgi:hypothetical protein
MIFRASNAFADEMDCLDAQNKMMAQIKQAQPEKADSVNPIIDRNKKKMDEYKEKAGKLLTMADDSISDAARGNDAIYPMFAATVWERLGNADKVRANFEKVLKKAEVWVAYKNRSDTKLPEYDRLMSAVPFVLQKAREMKDFKTAARAAQIAYDDSKEPQYKAMVDQFNQDAAKAPGPKEGTPQPLELEQPIDSGVAPE